MYLFLSRTVHANYTVKHIFILNTFLCIFFSKTFIDFLYQWETRNPNSPLIPSQITQSYPLNRTTTLSLSKMQTSFAARNSDLALYSGTAGQYPCFTASVALKFKSPFGTPLFLDTPPRKRNFLYHQIVSKFLLLLCMKCIKLCVRTQNVPFGNV